MLDECWRRIDAGISFTGMGFPYLPDLAEALPWVSGLGTAATALKSPATTQFGERRPTTRKRCHLYAAPKSSPRATHKV
jgi:hypothetical protein